MAKNKAASRGNGVGFDAGGGRGHAAKRSGSNAGYAKAERLSWGDGDGDSGRLVANTRSLALDGCTSSLAEAEWGL